MSESVPVLRHSHRLTWRSLGRVFAIKISKHRSHPAVAWADNLILAAKTVRNAAGLAPFPYVKFAADIVIQILEIIQLARQNQDDFKELGQNLVAIITAMRDTLRSFCDGYEPPSSFTAHCQAFIEKLLALSLQLNNAVRESQSWTRFFNAGTIRDTISQYRRELDGLRQNFTVTTLTQLSLKIFAEQSPRQLGYTWEYSQPLHFIDAMNMTIHLPMEFCNTRTDFEDLLKFMFRKRRGRRYVERGDYIITDQHTSRPIDASSWRSLVKAGSTIRMDVVVRSEMRDRDNDSRQCPACAYLCVDVSLGDEVTCVSCGTLFRVNRGFVDEAGSEGSTSTNSASGSSSVQGQDTPSQLQFSSANSDDDPELTDIRFFRRFFVLLEEIQVVEAESGYHLLSGSGIYGCATCKTHLAAIGSLLSRAFNGQHGRGYLFDRVVNIIEGEPAYRMLTTGKYVIRDIYCCKCGVVIGWKYDETYEVSQKYKEGNFILERDLLVAVQ